LARGFVVPPHAFPLVIVIVSRRQHLSPPPSTVHNGLALPNAVFFVRLTGMSQTAFKEGKMKIRISFLVVITPLLCFITTPAGAIDPDLGRFTRAKEQQIREFGRTITNKVPAIVWSFFDAVRADDWQTATNLASRIELASQRYAQATNDEAISPVLATRIWPPISESYGAYIEFHEWNSGWLHRFAKEIIQAIPRGSIYFGGTEQGRFIVSVMSESQVEGKPFFTVTQNQLVDQAYLDYLRVMYGNKIHIPTTNDSQNAFDEYVNDVRQRLLRRELKQRENVREVNGRIMVSGDGAAMQINGLIAKKLFEENPEREFFLEESYPLDWMYPQLAPHGLIFELQRQALTGVSESEVRKDQDYWKKLADEMLGSWLSETTSLKEITDFALKYGSGKNLTDYKGDKSFAANAASRKCFSKSRASLAGMYVWRMRHTQDADERERMYHAADLALRQSYAICPSSPEAIYRYVNLLQSRRRLDDAILIAKTSLHLDPENQELQGLVSYLVKSY
jgi:hypothetical protein